MSPDAPLCQCRRGKVDAPLGFFTDTCVRFSNLLSDSSFFQVKHVKHSGNISLDDVIEIARIMRPRSMAKELKGTVKEILGTAKSTGCTVEGEDPQDVQQSIQDGDIEIPDM